MMTPITRVCGLLLLFQTMLCKAETGSFSSQLSSGLHSSGYQADVNTSTSTSAAASVSHASSTQTDVSSTTASSSDNHTSVTTPAMLSTTDRSSNNPTSVTIPGNPTGTAEQSTSRLATLQTTPVLQSSSAELTTSIHTENISSVPMPATSTYHSSESGPNPSPQSRPPGGSTSMPVTHQNVTQVIPTSATGTTSAASSDSSSNFSSTQSTSPASTPTAPLNISTVTDIPSTTGVSVTTSDINSTVTTTTTTTGNPTNGETVSDFSNLPKSERMVFAIIAIPALVFGMTAFKYLKLTVFFAGWAALGYAFYVFSPLAFKTTPVCCGENGTKLGHVGVSIGVGLIGGLITLKLLRLGLFAVGACMGLLIGVIIIYTPLHNESFFSTNYGFTVYYASFAFVFGVVAMFAEKHTIVFSSALAGSFVFALGVDYFATTGFSEIVASVLLAAESRMKEEVEHHKTTGSDIKHIYSPDGHKAYYMLGGWIGVWVLSIIVQYRLMYRKDKPKDKRAKRRQPNDLEFYDDDELLILPPAHGRSRRSAPRRSRYADDDEVFQWSRERLDRRPAYPAERAYDQRWTSSTDPAVDRYGQRGRYSERDDFIEMRDYY
eukprot:m.249165 g.249165  ORF g.249165 m.249165 type:complete len:605 (+) comp19516_c1_seq1:184-1998(+)